MKTILGRKIVALAFSSLLLAPLTAQAAAEKYVFEPSHTQVFFSTEHMGISHPMGRFMKIEGGYTFDTEHVEQSIVEVKIDANSLDMNSAAWDEHMKNKDFFNVAQFPTITFKSTKIEKTGEKTGKLTGDLTLMGVTKPVTLDVTYNGSTRNPMNKGFMSGFNATGKLKRSDFGMSAFIPMVGDEATLTINVEGLRQDFENLKQ